MIKLALRYLLVAYSVSFATRSLRWTKNLPLKWTKSSSLLTCQGANEAKYAHDICVIFNNKSYNFSERHTRLYLKVLIKDALTVYLLIKYSKVSSIDTMT